MTARIEAAQGWQDSGIHVGKDDTVSLTHGSGKWTVDNHKYPQVGPGGYDATADAQILQECKLDTHKPYGILLARAGIGQAIPIGTRKSFISPGDGSLQFRINDNDPCLIDNIGTIALTIKRS